MNKTTSHHQRVCLQQQQQQQKAKKKKKDLTGDSVDGKVWFVHLCMHACWHLNNFSCHPRSVIGFESACFCSITRWIVSTALGNQATVCTLLSYNFLCMVMMLNSKGQHGSAPKLKTVSRALNGWCMSGGKEAGELYLASALPSKSSRTGFDISQKTGDKNEWVSEFLQEEECQRPEDGAAVACCVLFICTKRNRKPQL